MTYASNLSHHGLRLREWFDASRKAFAKHRAQRRVYNQTLTELLSMSDHDLADIGFARASIKEIAHAAAYGEQVEMKSAGDQ